MMSPLFWLLMLVLLAAAGAAGFYLGRASSDETRRAQRLEQDLERAHADLARYQEQVARHFGKTAHLFNNLTSTYRTLYEHLSLGSHILAKAETPRLEGGVPQGELDEEPLEADAERLPLEPDEWAAREPHPTRRASDDGRKPRDEDGASVPGGREPPPAPESDKASVDRRREPAGGEAPPAQRTPVSQPAQESAADAASSDTGAKDGGVSHEGSPDDAARPQVPDADHNR